MSRHGLFPTFALVLGLLAMPARAQVVPTVDVGVVSLGYTGTARAMALSVTPMLRIEQRLSVSTASATFSQFDGGDWSAQGALASSVFSPAWGRLRGELSASASAIAHRDVFRTGDALVRARVHAHGASLGTWAGGGGGWARHAGRWHPTSLAEAGLWADRGPLRVTATLTHRLVAVADSFVDDRGVFARFRRRAAHTDAVLGLSWERGPLALEAVAGARAGDALAPDARWSGVSATVRLAPWMSVLVEAGGEPAIIAQQLPEGKYGLVALRFTPGARARMLPTVRSLASAPPITDFVLRPETDGLRRIRIEEPAARRVELRADFTDWQPVPLVRGTDGSWQIALPLAPGVYRVSIRVDGGAWRAPTGVPSLEDEFGNVLGLLLVP